jgi:hypothetical protein
MLPTEVEQTPTAELSAEKIRDQLELMVQDHVFRSSKRSIEFLRFVVEQTLKGASEQIKERTIGVEVFGRAPSYDTNMDHVVRTAAIELRKRLAIYYGEEKHRNELRMSLVPGSYIPRFALPTHPAPAESEPEFLSLANVLPSSPEIPATPAVAVRNRRPIYFAGAAVAMALAALVYAGFHASTAQDVFWRPVFDTPGSVLVAVGDVPNGPPTTGPADDNEESSLPTLQAASSPTVPFADTVTIASVVGILEAHGKKVLIRRESASSFSDLREGAVVLIGAFNNEWSLRLTHGLRYTLALDGEKHLVYIRDAKNPQSRAWSWGTDKPTTRHHGAGAPVLQDYALISRIWNSDTGHVVIVIGGLYTYGTQTAGEFLTDPQFMQAVTKSIPADSAHRNLQIVLGTTVTDDTPGPPRILAVSVE